MPVARDAEQSGTIGAANDAVTVDCGGSTAVMIAVDSTTASLNISFEASWDSGTTYDALTAIRRDATGSSEATSITVGNSQSWRYEAQTYGADKVRARCSSYTSGSCTALLSPH